MAFLYLNVPCNYSFSIYPYIIYYNRANKIALLYMGSRDLSFATIDSIIICLLKQMRNLYVRQVKHIQSDTV